MGVLPHIIWAPSSLSSCCLLPQSPLCVLRPIQLSPMPPATTFPTPTGLPSPTPQRRPRRDLRPHSSRLHCCCRMPERGRCCGALCPRWCCSLRSCSSCCCRACCGGGKEEEGS